MNIERDIIYRWDASLGIGERYRLDTNFSHLATPARAIDRPVRYRAVIARITMAGTRNTTLRAPVIA
jgi:hypothetical protein